MTVITIPIDDVRHLEDPDGDVHEATVSSLHHARLARALRRLPALERRVLEYRFGLHDSDELTHRQVAKRLSISAGRAWYLERRALGLLRDDFEIEVAA